LAGYTAISALKSSVLLKGSDMDFKVICDIFNRELGFLGYLVIDSVIKGRSSGGVRMTEEVTLDETKDLARNMTLKHGFLGIPLGGAKLGIRISEPLTNQKRALIFKCIGRNLKSLIANGHYFPGTDMGTTHKDIGVLMNSATGQNKNWPYYPSGKYTAWTMLISTLEALKASGLRLGNSSVAVQGFGKVGTWATKVFSKNGARIVAVSTVRGGIYNPKGLHITKLLALKKEMGDNLVNSASIEATRISKDELLNLPVDILLLCAGSRQIHIGNCRKIQSKIICPGANIPITKEADENLFKKDIIVLPDFVSNSGGALGSYLASSMNEPQIKSFMEEWFSKKVRKVIAISREEEVSPLKVAERIAVSRFKEVKIMHEGKDVKWKIFQILGDCLEKVYRSVE